MKLKRFLWVAILGLLALIQFVPVDLNNPPVEEDKNLVDQRQLSDEAVEILQSACYDCHSFETKYPWYSHVAPVSFFLENHIKHGRGELNFSEFESYDNAKKQHKLKECVKALKEGWMPLENYTWMHSEAKLTQTQRELLATELQKLLENVGS